MAITAASLNFIFPLLFFLLLSTHSSATSISITDSFIECLNNNVDPSFPINEVIYTPINSSFPSVLQSYIHNLRFNTPTTPKPTLIITALHASHIQAAVVCGRTHSLLLITRSGGHDFEGLSYSSTSNQPFFIIDMFNLRSINITIEDESAWIETGAILGEVYYRIAEKSKTHAFPAGVCPTVGVGGHFSGGGYGNLMRKYGLSVDNIVDAQLIDVNGMLLDRKSMGEDLFWAITGGGGVSFGVVLAYKVKLVHVPSVVTVFNIERISSSEKEKVSTIAQKWVQVADKLDNDLFMRMNLVVVTDKNGEKTISLVFKSLFLGNSTTLVAVLNKDFSELGLEKSECVEMSWVESLVFLNDHPIGTPINVLLNRENPPTTQLKIKSDYVKNPISDEEFEFIFEKLKEFELCDMTFSPYGGRMSEISEFAKPLFPHRSGNIAKIQYAVCWEEVGVEAENRNIRFIRKMYDYMAPFVSKNPREAYLNYRDLDIGVNSHGKNAYFEGKVYGHKYFKETNYKRLTLVKSRVDPSNLFRNEQSIPVWLSTPAKTESERINNL